MKKASRLKEKLLSRLEDLMVYALHRVLESYSFVGEY